VVNREGSSNYYLNNTRCRRRDITDLFLGTAPGPRRYIIIEQSMFSRLIKARLEDMRIYPEKERNSNHLLRSITPPSGRD